MIEVKVQSNGEILVPRALVEVLGYRPGDKISATFEGGRIVLSLKPLVKYIGTIIDDPLSGFPVLDFGDDAPVLTHEQVRAMLTDFP